MKVAFNDFKKQYAAHKSEYDAAISRVLESGWYILGAEDEAFEKKFAEYTGAAYAIGVGNGLEALQIILLALGIGPGDEVLTTSHSAVASTLAIRAVGATPVFVDIDTYYHLDASKVEAAVTPKTKAILPVHLYGQSADMESITAIAHKYSLFVVEDCAQAHGARQQGKHVGTFGTAGAFSFYPTKNLGAFGDGGAIITGDASLAEKCRMIRNYGQKNRYEHLVFGINSRLDELQAAILSVQLTHLDQSNARRTKIARLYSDNLSGIKQVTLPELRAGNTHAYHLFVIRAERRDDLKAHLESHGIAALIHYPIPIHEQQCFPEYNSLHLPILERAVKEILSLPIHPYLTDEEVLFVVEKIKQFYAA